MLHVLNFLQLRNDKLSSRWTNSNGYAASMETHALVRMGFIFK